MIDTSKFVNYFELPQDVVDLVCRPTTFETSRNLSGADVGLPDLSFMGVQDLMIPLAASVLCNTVNQQSWQAVGLDGYADKPVERVGNYRLSTWSPEIAAALWERLQGLLPPIRAMDPYTPTDHDNHPLWKPVGVSPLLRFIRYEEGGQLVAHYDATFVQDETHRTLQSLVIYLTSNEHGATRFLVDPQADKRVDEMDFSDWDRAGESDEVLFRCPPFRAEGIVFDHRLLHDGEPLGDLESEKIIIRTDSMYEKV